MSLFFLILPADAIKLCVDILIVFEISLIAFLISPIGIKISIGEIFFCLRQIAQNFDFLVYHHEFV